MRPHRLARSLPTRGFTLPELIAVMVIVAVLAVVALPRLDVALVLRADSYRDQVVAALRLAQHTAVGHRRLVCVNLAAQSVSLTIAAANPATACTATLPPAAGSAHAQADGGVTSTLSPAGTLYFQPNGRITTTGTGTTAGTWSIAFAGSSATPAAISITGETGFVQ